MLGIETWQAACKASALPVVLSPGFQSQQFLTVLHFHFCLHNWSSETFPAHSDLVLGSLHHPGEGADATNSELLSLNLDGGLHRLFEMLPHPISYEACKHLGIIVYKGSPDNWGTISWAGFMWLAPRGGKVLVKWGLRDFSS